MKNGVSDRVGRGKAAMVFDEVAKPTGEIGSVCWALMGGIVIAWGISLKWLTSQLDKKESELKDEQARSRQDRKDFEAQTNVMLQNLYRKKGGSSSDT